MGQRFYGFGSVFGKTLRDCRFSILAVAAVLSAHMLLGGQVVASSYGTVEARQHMATYAAEVPPAMRGMYSNPVNVNTLGGSLSWLYGGFVALIAGLWSILALSTTLATDARRGSLDLVATTPITRRRIALEKVGAHVAAVTVAMFLVAAATWLTGVLNARLPGDAIAPEAAIAFSIRIGLLALVAGAVAFALAPFVGSRAAAGLAGAVMLGSYVVNGYQALIPPFSAVAGLTWFSWTAGHLPLAGVYDWPPLLLVAGVAAVLLGIGIETFARRDLMPSTAIRTPGLPAFTLGLRGPVRRSFGDQLPMGLAWGIGVGIFGLLMAAMSPAFADSIRKAPEAVKMASAMFPGVDIASPGGLLQLTFMAFGFILAGLAAATLVGGWASDETSGRLEIQLSTPMTRARSLISGALGVYLAIGVIVVILAAGIAAGSASAGGDVATPTLGTLVLGAYAAGLAGIGFAVGGAIRASIAGPAVVLLVLATFLLDLLASALQLPDWVRQLALTAHLGQPMIGRWDSVGIAACLVLAVAGLFVGAWGIRRRDVNG